MDSFDVASRWAPLLYHEVQEYCKYASLINELMPDKHPIIEDINFACKTIGIDNIEEQYDSKLLEKKEFYISAVFYGAFCDHLKRDQISYAEYSFFNNAIFSALF